MCEWHRCAETKLHIRLKLINNKNETAAHINISLIKTLRFRNYSLNHKLHVYHRYVTNYDVPQAIISLPHILTHGERFLAQFTWQKKQYDISPADLNLFKQILMQLC